MPHAGVNFFFWEMFLWCFLFTGDAGKPPEIKVIRLLQGARPTQFEQQQNRPQNRISSSAGNVTL